MAVSPRRTLRHDTRLTKAAFNLAILSRTVNPIHFEDLEPRRFEDLVRQLAYDFRVWQKLEATGRAGSDDGFDARGWEALGNIEPNEGDEEDESDRNVTDDQLAERNRIWLIQCKREASIGPTKLLKYLGEIDAAERRSLYGLIFAAPANISKRARDGLFAACAKDGISEVHVWGRSELEDMLFQPKNDHLLFAYFGFSLTVRRRSIKTELRARLAMKRKAHKHLEDNWVRVLLRDPEASDYPYPSSMHEFAKKPLWRAARFDSFEHDGALFVLRRHRAYLSDDNLKWDAALAINEEKMHHMQQPPWEQALTAEEERLVGKSAAEWDALSDDNKAWLEIKGLIKFDDMLDIDPLGDEFVEAPHIYVPFIHERMPYSMFQAEITSMNGSRMRYLPNSDDDREAMFSEDLRYSELERAPSVGKRHPPKKVT